MTHKRWHHRWRPEPCEAGTECLSGSLYETLSSDPTSALLQPQTHTHKHISYVDHHRPLVSHRTRMAGWMRVQCLVNGTLHPKPPPYADLVSLRTTSPEFPIDSAATGTNSNLRAEQATEQKRQVTLSCKQATSCYLLFCREKCGNVEKPLPPPPSPQCHYFAGAPLLHPKLQNQSLFPPMAEWYWSKSRPSFSALENGLATWDQFQHDKCPSFHRGMVFFPRSGVEDLAWAARRSLLSTIYL